ncbi:MAG: hypothetical protein ABIH86_05975 [Planctomycetota bacterium]
MKTAVTSLRASGTVRFYSSILLALMSVGIARITAAASECVNPWIESDADVSAGRPMPNIFSMDAFHASPMFKELKPKEFCRELFEIYYDGRRKSWGDFQKGMTLWAHTAQEPRASGTVIDLDPVVLLNVHGTGYCGIQSGLLEGIYQSRPGGTPGKPLIEARRWYVDGCVHSIADAFYDGRWHYYDIDLGGWAGDADKDVWSVADMLLNREDYFSPKTTIKSNYFFKADKNGEWVMSANPDPKKSYMFQDNLMLGHEMTFTLRKGETFTRYFTKAAAGFSETLPHTKKFEADMKGYAELVFEPDAGDLDALALTVDGKTRIFDIRCPYNIASSVVSFDGNASVSFDLGKTWEQLAADGIVSAAVNRWDYLLKVEGDLKKVVTHAVLHPAALPRIGKFKTKMTVSQPVAYRTLTWIPDWSTEEALKKTASFDGLKMSPAKMSFSDTPGVGLTGSGSVTVPVSAPPGSKIVKIGVCVIGGSRSNPTADDYMELSIGTPEDMMLVERTTDTTVWAKEGGFIVNQWQLNVNGSRTIAPTDTADIRLKLNGYCMINSLRVYVGYVRDGATLPAGELVVTHGYDGKTFTKTVDVKSIAKNPVEYSVPDGATANEFIRMEIK